MEIQIDITKDFEKDLKKLTAVDIITIKSKVNFILDLIRAGQKTSNYLYRLRGMPINLELDSSLYILKINNTLRAIVTFEDDPLFDQKIMTLLRIVNHSNLDLTFKSLYESIYQSLINNRAKKNG